MRTLLVDMPAGVAGDMLLAGLIDAGASLASVRTALDGLGIGHIGIRTERVRRGPLVGTLVEVDAPQAATWSTGLLPRLQLGLTGRPGTGERPRPGAAGTTVPAAPPAVLPAAAADHGHRPYRDIRALLERATLPERVRDRAQRVFRILAQAEGAVHGVDPETVEFHEVGAVDAIADVVGVCAALEDLGVDRLIASAITPGHGVVRCAHGEMSVPVPAVAQMLAASGAPTRLLSSETGELTTPTGCALIVALQDGFVGGRTPTPPVTGRILAIGTGAGHRDPPERANCLRVSLLEHGQEATGVLVETIAEVRLQVDDATGEQLADLLARCLAQGALDAYLTPVLMKKGRPGHELTVLAPVQLIDPLATLLLGHSSSLGLRWQLVERRILPRAMAEVQVRGHRVRLKIAQLPDGNRRAKPEADDVARAAAALELPFTTVQQEALAAWHPHPPP